MKGFKKFLMVVVACVCACFCFACGGSKANVPETVADAKAKMEEAGYTVEEADAEDLTYYVGATAMLWCELDDEELTVTWFADEATAAAQEEAYDSAVDAGADPGDYEWGCDGVIFYEGTSAAVDAFTK